MEQGSNLQPAWATCGEAPGSSSALSPTLSPHFPTSFCVMGGRLLGWPGMALLFPWLGMWRGDGKGCRKGSARVCRNQTLAAGQLSSWRRDTYTTRRHLSTTVI